MNTTHNSTGRKIAKVIGIDLAKDHCDAVGYDENQKICFKLAEFVKILQKNGAIGISVGSQASVMLDLGLILERIFTL